jgi:hypothetical protein
MATVYLQGGDRAEPLAAFADTMLERLQDLSPLLKEVAEEILQPALGRHYEASGLKERSGVMKTAVTQTGARGHLLEVRPNGLTIGIDYNALPYAKYAIEGRGPVVPKTRKALHWKDESGHDVFATRVRASGPHDIYYLTEAEFSQVARALTEKLGCSRSSGRERIETGVWRWNGLAAPCCSRSSGRERIETGSCRNSSR